MGVCWAKMLQHAMAVLLCTLVSFEFAAVRLSLVQQGLTHAQQAHPWLMLLQLLFM
jgi:hypothetical protein